MNCPIHSIEMIDGKWGPYHRDGQGWCKGRPKSPWAGAQEDKKGQEIKAMFDAKQANITKSVALAQAVETLKALCLSSQEKKNVGESVEIVIALAKRYEEFLR